VRAEALISRAAAVCGTSRAGGLYEGAEFQLHPTPGGAGATSTMLGTLAAYQLHTVHLLQQAACDPQLRCERLLL
jgi:hypothetical protein